MFIILYRRLITVLNVLPGIIKRWLKAYYCVRLVAIDHTDLNVFVIVIQSWLVISSACLFCGICKSENGLVVIAALWLISGRFRVFHSLGRLSVCFWWVFEGLGYNTHPPETHREACLKLGFSSKMCIMIVLLLPTELNVVFLLGIFLKFPNRGITP